MNDTAPGSKTPESSRSAFQRHPSRDVMVRNMPEASYQLLRRVAFDADVTYAEVLAYALDVATLPVGTNARTGEAIALAFRNEA